MEDEEPFNGFDVPEGFPNGTHQEFMTFHFDKLRSKPEWPKR